MPERRQSLARTQLEQLVQSVNEYIAGIDELMGVPPCHERGVRQTLLLNRLETAKNVAECFTVKRPKTKTSAQPRSGIRGIAPGRP